MRRGPVIVAIAMFVGAMAWLLFSGATSPTETHEEPETKDTAAEAVKTATRTSFALQPASIETEAQHSSQIEGDIVDSDDQGVATGQLLLVSGDRHVTVSTDANGHFRVSDLPNGQWTLVAAFAVDLGAVEVDFKLDVTPQLAARALKFRLPGATTYRFIEGKELPVVGATIVVVRNRFQLRQPHEQQPGLSDRDGHLKFAELPGDDAIARHPGFEDTALVRGITIDHLDGREQWVRLDARGSHHEIAVRIIDAHDAGIADATFEEMVLTSAGSITFPLTTNLPKRYVGDGHYLVQWLDPSEGSVSALVFGARHRLDVKLKEEQVVEVQRPNAIVVAHVRMQSGSSVQDFFVQLSNDEKTRHGERVLSASGAFRMSVTAGSWSYCIDAPDLVTTKGTFTVDDDKETTLDIVMPIGRALHGRVVDRVTHQPIEGANITARDAAYLGLDGTGNGHARSDSDGRFSLRGLSQAQTTFNVYADGYSLRTVALPADRQDVEVDLSAGKWGTSEYEGIGGTMDVCARDAGICFTDFLAGSGARSAGIQAGDEVLAVDGDSAEGKGMIDVIDRIRGPSGTLVHLTVQRGGATLEFNVMRRVLTQSSE